MDEKKATILCIEDEEELLEDLCEELQEAGYRFLKATDGREGLECLKQEKPDLIICDMMMPNMDGQALLKELRGNFSKFDDVPFVFLTAKATRDDIIAGKRLGAEEYLTKPVDYDLLLATVESSLAQVERIQNRDRKKLMQIYQMFKKQRGTEREIRVAFVTDNPQTIAPLSTALTDLGCTINFVTEKQLAHKTFDLSNTDIVFLVYSKIVHYYLRYIADKRDSKWTGTSVLLAPSTLSSNQKDAFLENGIDECIHYPYPPIDIFKLIIKRLKNAA
ncbi:response regulator [Roseibium sp. Sym1]|uniref:response regulator n=1 Tax=Roseibium sp. Sym1 TaxID=3016006 RepID=UPI0022B57283|nr:response regulator [Roseibium sp. Sym1]